MPVVMGQGELDGQPLVDLALASSLRVKGSSERRGEGHVYASSTGSCIPPKPPGFTRIARSLSATTPTQVRVAWQGSQGNE